MKNFSQKIIASLIIFSLIFSLSQFIFIKKVNAQSVSGDSGNTTLDFSGAVGKAIGAGIACFAGHFTTELLKKGVSAGLAWIGASAKSTAVSTAATAAILHSVPVSPASEYAAAEAAAKTQPSEEGTFQGMMGKSFDYFETCFKSTVIKILMDYVVDQVTDWIQNGGDFGKRFDMGNFEKKAKNSAFGEVLDSAFPFLCSSFQLQVKLSFMPVAKFSKGISCTLDKITGNIENFTKDFNQGGWLAYNAMWEPQNNYFGATLMINDQANSEAGKAEKKASDDLNRGAGFLPMTRCEPSVSKNEIKSDSNGNKCTENDMVSLRKQNNDKQICIAVYVQDSSNNWCKKNNLQNTTPGRVVGDLVQKSVVEKGTFGWLDSIGSSDDVGRWVTAIIDAVYNRVMKEGLAYARRSMNLDKDEIERQSRQEKELNNAAANEINNSSAISVAKDPSTNTLTAVGGSSGVLVGSYQLTAKSSSPITLKQVLINIPYLNLNVFSNFYITVGSSTFGSNSSGASMVFSNNASIAAGSSAIVKVYADISPGAIDETKSPATSFGGCTGTTLISGTNMLIACDLPYNSVSGQDVNTLSALALAKSSSVQDPLIVTSTISSAQLIGEYSIFNRSSDKNITLTSIKITNASPSKFNNLILTINGVPFGSSGSGSSVSFSDSAIIPFNSSAEIKVYADVSLMSIGETVNNATTLNSCSGSGGFACYPVNVPGQSVNKK